jgi:starch synthase (maltosyl-transferring)
MIGRFPIVDISPVISFGGEIIGVKAVPNEAIAISATVTREGHDALGVHALLLDSTGTEVKRVAMREIWPGTDRYEAHLSPTSVGKWFFAIEAFDDPFHTWAHDAGIKIPNGIDVELCFLVGVNLFQEAISAKKRAKAIIGAGLEALRDKKLTPAQRFEIATTAEIREFFHHHPIRRLVTASEKFPIRVEPTRALVGAWYEFFPRSEGAIRNKDGSITPGTFKSAVNRLQVVAEMGFDIIYLPPIHPIGTSFRKGKNNTLTASESDPGVPWAIGSSAGGHDAINPELGTFDDFESFLLAAKKLNLEVALDLALQTSPDHPWVKEHPEWFTTRLDGSIAYAENPPKKYQDIYPMNFDNDYPGIVTEVMRILLFWISKGIKTFRVDNPHTKPVRFWQDVISEINYIHPDVIFLSEAFTRPAMMHALGKAGFQQSYTYFTWRTSKNELTEYGNEVAHETAAYFRPNFWVNTPDILPFHLQSGNPAVFAQRAVLAATMSPSWGMYAGYELYEHLPVRDGAEEYRDSEKYEIKVRDWASAEKAGLTLTPFITRLNEIRRAHPALQQLRNLEFHNTDSEQVLAYSKREGDDLILVVVNLDPIRTQETTVHWNMYSLGLAHDVFEVQDLLGDSHHTWSPHTFVRLDPTRPVGKIAHICQVKIL